MSNKRWTENLNIALSLNIPHVSCYALTVEPKTALASFIKNGSIPLVEDAVATEQYTILLELTENAGYDNYEFSNFGKNGFKSLNNTAYWTGKHFLGIGPSAHSYDGNSRSWNVSNNTKYIKSIKIGVLPIEREILSETDKYNEYVMTGLRTKWGVSIDRIAKDFGEKYKDYLQEQAKVHLDEGLLTIDNKVLLVSKKGKFLSDGIAADLFLVNLD
jgi:oxygen-independent coproporphyrinogen-3 oxidase